MLRHVPCDAVDALDDAALLQGLVQGTTAVPHTLSDASHRHACAAICVRLLCTSRACNLRITLLTASNNMMCVYVHLRSCASSQLQPRQTSVRLFCTL